jgi:cytochrome c oxidase subunit 2
MRRGVLVQLVVIALLAAGAGVGVAIGFPWLPVSAAVERDRMDFLFWFTVGICIFVFSIVAAMMGYAVLHFRARPDDDSDGSPIHGHTGLEITWTIIPTLLVTSIAVASAIVLGRNDNAGAHPFRVDVTAQQFAWSFSYPTAKNVTTAILRLPVDRSVQLTLNSKDVIHSFWVPEFGQKQDAVPGLKPTLHITPTRTGRFPVICTELCGLGHSVMRSWVIVMERPAFDRWLARQRRLAGGGGATTGGGANAAGKQVYANNGCGSCHTFQPAGSNGKIGPDLDKLPQEAQRAGQPLEAFTRESIVNPNAYVEKGYPPNVMPTSFKNLPKDQLDALVAFLTEKR